MLSRYGLLPAISPFLNHTQHFLVKTYRDRNYGVVANVRSGEREGDEGVLYVAGDIADRNTAEQTISEQLAIAEMERAGRATRSRKPLKAVSPAANSPDMLMVTRSIASIPFSQRHQNAYYDPGLQGRFLL